MKTLTGLWPNLARAYEIARLGNFTITVTYQKTSDYVGVHDDYQKIKEFYKDVQFVKSGDIWIELTKPHSYEKLFGYETLGDIHARVEKAKKYKLPEDTLDEPSEELLKTAVQRLFFSLKDVEIIHKIAQVIAQLDGESDIRAHHIAEAIHYQIKTYHPDDKLIVADDSVLYFGKYITIHRDGLDGMYADEKRSIRKAIHYLKSLL